jgi:hypothetical protein
MTETNGEREYSHNMVLNISDKDLGKLKNEAEKSIFIDKTIKEMMIGFFGEDEDGEGIGVLWDKDQPDSFCYEFFGGEIMLDLDGTVTITPEELEVKQRLGI